MIEALRNSDVANMVGGRFRLVTLIQRRWSQLIEGARPLVERKGMTDLELIIEEIRQGKITLEYMEENAEELEHGSN